MAGRLRLIVDGSSTTQIHRFSIPSKSVRQRHPCRERQTGDYFQLQFDDGNTGDTVDWGVSDAVLFGVKAPRDIDP